jgi:hypothetical protein
VDFPSSNQRLPSSVGLADAVARIADEVRSLRAIVAAGSDCRKPQAVQVDIDNTMATLQRQRTEIASLQAQARAGLIGVEAITTGLVVASVRTRILYFQAQRLRRTFLLPVVFMLRAQPFVVFGTRIGRRRLPSRLESLSNGFEFLIELDAFLSAPGACFCRIGRAKSTNNLFAFVVGL